jgi:hypothetical protein
VNITSEKEFRFGSFRVAISRSLLKKWNTTPAKEKWKIIDSLVAVLYRGVRKVEHAINEPAIEGVRAYSDFSPLYWEKEDEEDEPAKFRRSARRLKRMIRSYRLDSDSLDREEKESEDDYQGDLLEEVRRPQRLLRHRELKARVLSLLRFELHRDWSRSPIAPLFKQGVMWAADDGDQRFFKTLGETLKDKPIPRKVPRDNPLKQILIDRWIVPKGICLCWFSDKALANFLRHTDQSYSPDAIRKTRERLRLRKVQPPIVRSVEITANRINLG